jgi:hypothetical protein
MAGKGSSEVIYKKDGTFSSKTKAIYTKPKQYTLDMVGGGTWKLDGDKFSGKTKIYSVTSKDAPEIAKAIEELEKLRLKQIEKYGEDEDEYDIVVELTKNRFATISDVEVGEKNAECKAK